MKQQNRLYLNVFLLYLLAFSIIFLIIISREYNKTVKYDKYLQDTIENQNFTGYIDIRIQKSPCNTNYENIIKYKVPSVRSYCKINSSEHLEGVCKSNSSYGKTMQGMSEQNINQINGIYYCGKKSPVIFLDTLEAINKKCPKEYKLCGRDSKEGLCFPQHFDCPINDIIISQNQLQNLKEIGYQEIKQVDSFNKNLYLYTTNKKTDNQILVEFTFGYKKICVNPEQEQVPKKQMKYFNKQYIQYCEVDLGDNEIDDRYFSLISVNKLNLYKENGVDQMLGKNYDLYNSNDIDYDIQMFVRSNIYFTQQCKEFFYRDNINGIHKSLQFNQIKNFFIFLILIYISFIIIVTCSCCALCFNFIGSNNSKLLCPIVTFCMTFICVVLGLILYIYIFNKNNIKGIVKLDQMKCSDKIFNSIINDQSQKFQKSNNKLMICLILTLFTIFLYFIYIYLICCKKQKRNQDRQYDQLKDSKEINSSSSSSENIQQNQDQYVHMKSNHYYVDPYYQNAKHGESQIKYTSNNQIPNQYFVKINYSIYQIIVKLNHLFVCFFHLLYWSFNHRCYHLVIVYH